MVKKISVISTSRADYGILRPLLRELKQEGFDLELLVSGSHFLDEQGSTVNEIEKDALCKMIPLPVKMAGGESALEVSQFMAETLKVFGQHFAKSKPDLLITFGDRFEMFSAASSAIPYLIPMAHIAGGATTLGAFDNTLRHCLSKMAHRHFVETEHHKNKLLSLGEEAGRIYVVGALNIDNLSQLDLPKSSDVLKALELPVDSKPILVTYHPETNSEVSAVEQIDEVLKALENFKDQDIVITGPNIDTDANVIKKNILAWIEKHPRARFVQSLGTARYFALLKVASCMIGNSSSGLIETASFKLPVVNIGHRQKGRFAPENVLHVEGQSTLIVAAMKKALSLDFKNFIQDLINPYGDGQAAKRIVGVLKNLKINQQNLIKD